MSLFLENAVDQRQQAASSNQAHRKHEEQGRDDARRGIFHPPFHRIGWRTEEGDRVAAQDAYSKGYWTEIARQRFEAGDYDLL